MTKPTIAGYLLEFEPRRNIKSKRRRIQKKYAFREWLKSQVVK